MVLSFDSRAESLQNVYQIVEDQMAYFYIGAYIDFIKLCRFSGLDVELGYGLTDNFYMYLFSVETFFYKVKTGFIDQFKLSTTRED